MFLVFRSLESTVKMRFFQLLVTGIIAPIGSLAAPSSDVSARSDISSQYDFLNKRENLCNLKAPPALCQPNASVTVDETALRAYQFYRAFVVDGDPRKMFSLIDSSYIVGFLNLAADGTWTNWGTYDSNTIRDTRAGRARSGLFSAMEIR